MRTTRRLALAKETLAPLGADQLADIGGGSHLACPTHGQTCDFCATVPLNDCIERITDAIYIQQTPLCIQTS